jgi:hypothetical protein
LHEGWVNARLNVRTDQHFSSFRGIAGFIGDEPGIHFAVH